MALDLPFGIQEAIVTDFEFREPNGEHPEPVCLVAWELNSGRKIRLTRAEMGTSAPYDLSEKTVFVSFSLDAELNCHQKLGWELPTHSIDLHAEFLQVLNCTPRPPKEKDPDKKWGSVLHAANYYGLDAMEAAVKKRWRDLILSDGIRTAEELDGILNYCETDVQTEVRILFAMIRRGHIQLDRRLFYALNRGRYLRAISRMEFTGIPIDLERYDRVKPRWPEIRMQLVDTLGRQYGAYNEDGSFSHKLFGLYLNARGWSWPRTKTGRLETNEKTFKRMVLAHPELEDLRQLKHCLEQLELHDLYVGRDGYARCWLAPFASRTGRNQPSNSHFILGMPSWIRSFLIQAKPGWAVVVIDWVAQEFGIAAYLSGDLAMQEAYESGDPYLTFGKQARLVPASATAQTASLERDRFKITVLATQYGQGYQSLAEQINQPDIVARELLARHRKVYRRFWEWSDNRVNRYLLNNEQQTVFGWTHRFKQRPKVNSIRNFDCQANGAEMLRLACCLGSEGGISLCAPLHDSILLQAPLERLDEHVAKMRDLMSEASRITLGGFRLRTDQHIFRYPEHYSDPKGRGRRMLETVLKLL